MILVGKDGLSDWEVSDEESATGVCLATSKTSVHPTSRHCVAVSDNSYLVRVGVERVSRTCRPARLI